MTDENPDKKAQEEIQQKYIAHQVSEQQIQQHQQQIEKFEGQLQEIQTVLDALSEVSKTKTETDVLVPLAGGIFFKAKITDSQKFLVNVGSNTVVERNVEETKKMVEKQLDEVSKFKDQVTENLTHLVTEHQMLEAELKQLTN